MISMLRYSMASHFDRLCISNEYVGYMFKNLMQCANDPQFVIPSLPDASMNIIDLHNASDALFIPHVPMHFSITRDFANGAHVVILLFHDTFSDMIDVQVRSAMSYKFTRSLRSRILSFNKVCANGLHVVMVLTCLIRLSIHNSEIDVQCSKLVSSIWLDTKKRNDVGIWIRSLVDVII